MRRCANWTAVSKGCQFEKRRGFTLFELAISASIIGILATVLLQFVLFYQEKAERVAIEQVIGALRTALHANIVALNIDQKSTDIANLVEQNPMEWLARKPANYLGEFYSPNEKDVPVGNWYFDRTQKNVVYLLNSGNFFRANELKQLKFKVRLVHLPQTPANTSGSPDTKVGVVLD